MPRARTKKRQSGFSMVEMMVALAILVIIMGIVIAAIQSMQQKNSAEIAHLDVTQEGREMVDQLVRDLHQAGFPGITLYPYNSGLTTSSKLLAVKLVAVSQTDVWFEGDIDGDGDVDSTRYTLCAVSSGTGSGSASSSCPWANSTAAVFTPGSGTATDSSLPTCPCTLRRSQVIKSDGVVPTQQAPKYFTEVQNINNGTSQPLFTAYGLDSNYNVVTISNIPPDLQDTTNQAAGTNSATLAQITMIRVNLNVLSNNYDPSTRTYPGVFITGTGKVGH